MNVKIKEEFSLLLIEYEERRLTSSSGNAQIFIILNRFLT